MTIPGEAILPRQYLLTDLLKRLSRSFYLTVRILPRSLRDEIGLAYLFARAADTIADTDVLHRAQRLTFLEQFRKQFGAREIDWHELREIQDAVVGNLAPSAERLLIERIEDCFRVFREIDQADRERICSLMRNLTPGMEMDLTLFPSDRASEVTALGSMSDLDRYMYHVAGCVGEFWTHMTCAHVRSLAGWKVADMGKIGVRFGKGLQLTNVLRDVARDLQRGRCYIPVSLLQEVGLKPADLLSSESLQTLRPILSRLIATALEHLDQGWLYTLAIPRREVRLRLACMWPLLFAVDTLRLVGSSRDLLNPAINVKMRKMKVRCLLVLTTVTGASNSLWTAYWGRQRKRIV